MSDSVTLAIVGGDEREQEIARLAVSERFAVRMFAVPAPPRPLEGVGWCASVREAVDGARVLLLPIPLMAGDGSVFAPEHEGAVFVEPEDLAAMEAPAHVVLGKADERLRAAAASTRVELHEYEHDRELMMLRAPAIVEGALRLAIQHTRVTLHGTPLAVVGFGNIGAQLAKTLHALGARVTVVARNPIQRAEAWAAGLDVAPIEDLERVASSAGALFSTVPARVVDGAVLAALPPGALVMDLAAPPGGVDFAAAARLGIDVVWARGMGRRAPVTVGASQWRGIRRIIAASLASAAPSRPA